MSSPRSSLIIQRSSLSSAALEGIEISIMSPKLPSMAAVILRASTTTESDAAFEEH
jgi:hypothetical protein